MSRLETYERIVDKADMLFRRFGFIKTPISDIARELEMSSANIYKFFPSKKALIEAVGEKRLQKLYRHIGMLTNTSKPVFQRIKDVIYCIVEHFEEVIEKEYDLLYVDMMNDVMKFTVSKRKGHWKWPANMRIFLRNEIKNLLLIGIETEKFQLDDPDATASALIDCLSYALEPSLLLLDAKPLRRERLERQFDLLERAVSAAPRTDENLC